MAWAGGILPLNTFSACAHPLPPTQEEPTSGNLDQQDASSRASSSAPDIESTLVRKFGIAGVYKLGHHCAVTIRIPARLSNNPVAVHITTIDGDAVEVVYKHSIAEQQPSGSDADRNRDIVVPIRIGRADSILTASLVDKNETEIIRQDLILSSESGLSPTQPLVLAVGSSMGAEDIVRSSVDGSVKSVNLLNIAKAEDLPQSYLEYSPVDLLILSTSDTAMLRGISPQQWKAMDDFIRRGGGCVLSLGAASDELRQFPLLMSWLPGNLEGEGAIRQPAALESLVTTDQRIQPFPARLIQATRGQTRLTLSDSLGKPTSWWVSMPHGFGTIQIIASDLDHPSFSQWKHRRLLWERLVSPYFEKLELESVKTASGSNVDSYLGYNDLTGQLRATLDRFPGVQVVSFSQVTAVLIGLLILIGPIDYLVSVRWLKRPHFSWYFAAGVLLATSLGLTWIYHRLRPDRILINTARIVDVDAQSGRVDGHQWSHIYSAKARKILIANRSNFTDAPVRLDWQGLPGSGLGGLQSSMQFERGMPVYSINGSSNGGSHILDVGIPAAGTKSLYATWNESLPGSQTEQFSRSGQILTNVGSSSTNQDDSLRELPSVDQLEGVVVNPLSVDLRDAALYYHRWYYALKSRMPPGDRVALSTHIIPRDVSRRLNRQQEKDGKLTTARWDPADRGQLDRLLELMMFHKAATGRNYTSLTHRYQPIVDHSNLLETNYAILVGRLDSPPTELVVAAVATGKKSDDSDVPMELVTDRTWVRIILPVNTQKSQFRNR